MEKIIKSHEDRKSVNASPISISRADMESLFIQKSIFGLNILMKPTMKMIIAPSSSFAVKRENDERGEAIYGCKDEQKYLMISSKMNNCNECN